ncbi:MAG: hypothetical protein BWZ10_02023 [candidate division BRC1 bacterium ADurb.BinA364]|nr:MAG: hypothetical protein BWZ10_02023 [candidate division BRC1 bacterium ADurb.BinA364]
MSHDRSRGAAKILRARSFYLSALTLAAIRLICRRCGLSPFCVLIDAGGRFTLLAPNLDSVREGLKKARQEIDRWLFGRFFGQLRLNLTDETTLTGQDFFGRFGDKMRELNDALDRAKRQPWSGQIQSEGQWRRGAFAFDDGYPYGETVCPISGYGRPEVEWPTGEGQTIKVSRQTAQERRIGEELARAKAIEISEAGGPDSVAFFENEARTFLRIHSQLPDLANSASGGELYALNELAPGFGCRVIANHVPRLTRELRERFAEQGLEDDELASSEIGDALTFEQIAALAERSIRIVSRPFPRRG